MRKKETFEETRKRLENYVQIAMVQSGWMLKQL